MWAKLYYKHQKILTEIQREELTAQIGVTV